MTGKPRIRVNTANQLTGATIDGEFVRAKPGVSYMKGGQSPFFFSWNPALREEKDDVRLGYVAAASRAIDAMHNSGWIAGAVDQSIASTIGGTGLRLAARPDRVALGWTAKQADEWSEIVERRWSTWSENPLECDAAGKMTVAQMEDAAMRSYYRFGEALALLPSIRRKESMTRLKVQLLPATRLVQDTNDRIREFQGVTVDSWGLPQSYRLRSGASPLKTTPILARDGANRPQVVHLFDGCEGQMRGITPLAPALRVVKQFDQLSDATLQAALIQAIFAATITSAAPTNDVLAALQSEEEQQTGFLADEGAAPIDALLAAQAAWYQNSKIDLGGAGRVTHLFPGETLDLKKSEHPNSTYEAFAKFLLREVARCLGMTFETLTGDYSGASYSSVRMATSEIWPVILKRRNNIPAKLAQTIYEAWLEEEIEAGTIPFPNGIFGFLANRPAAVVANWRGPAKPQADDLKTAKAHQIYKSMGIFSDERIADELGFDIGDEYERRAREVAIRAELKLPEGDTMAPPENDPADDVDEPTRGNAEVA